MLRFLYLKLITETCQSTFWKMEDTALSSTTLGIQAPPPTLCISPYHCLPTEQITLQYTTGSTIYLFTISTSIQSTCLVSCLFLYKLYEGMKLCLLYSSPLK